MRDVKTFSYTYPEIRDNPDKATLTATINKLYGQSTVSHKTKRTTDILEIGEVVDGVINGVAETIEKLVQPGQIDADAAKKDQKRFEYTANIKIDKCALGGSGSIYLFIGDFNDEPDQWRTDEHLAGASPLFVMDSGAVANGVSKDIYAAVSLTRELEQRVASKDLGCMDPSEVISYLSENLQWRIAKVSLPTKRNTSPEKEVVWCEAFLAVRDTNFSYIICGLKSILHPLGCPLTLRRSSHSHQAFPLTYLHFFLHNLNPRKGKSAPRTSVLASPNAVTSSSPDLFYTCNFTIFRKHGTISSSLPCYLHKLAVNAIHFRRSTQGGDYSPFSLFPTKHVMQTLRFKTLFLAFSHPHHANLRRPRPEARNKHSLTLLLHSRTAHPSLRTRSQACRSPSSRPSIGQPRPTASSPSASAPTRRSRKSPAARRAACQRAT